MTNTASHPIIQRPFRLPLIQWCVVLALFLAGASTAAAASPFSFQVYSAPMATIHGQGLASFRVTLGMLVTRDGNVAGVYRSYPSTSTTSLSELYPLSLLGSAAGAVLASYHGVPLLILRGAMKPTQRSASLRLAYITSFIHRRYATCTIHLAADSAGHWHTLGSAGKTIKTFTVTSGLDGVKAIQPCPQPATGTTP